MRDSYDTYFRGWALEFEEPAPEAAGFPGLVEAVGAFIVGDPATAEAWRTFPLDGKKECFFHFLKKAEAAGALPADSGPLLARLRSDYPRSMG